MTCFICQGPPPKRGQKVCDGSCGLCADCPGCEDTRRAEVGSGLQAWLEGDDD